MKLNSYIMNIQPYFTLTHSMFVESKYVDMLEESCD